MTIAIIDGRAAKPVIIGAGAEVAGALAATAQTAANAAAVSAEAAETARDVALTAGPYYTSAAAGEAATTTGQEFAVAVGDGTVAWYRRTSGGSDLIFQAVTGVNLSADQTSGNLLAGSAGTGALLNNTAAGTKDGDINTMFGMNTGLAATSAYALSLFGYGAGSAITSGHSNTLLGYQAGHLLTTGIMNTLVGVDAGYISTTMNRSVVVGHHCVNTGNYSGTGLIVIGQQTARPLTEGDDHIVIGRNAQASSPATGSGQSVVIGAASALASSVATSVVIGKDIMQSGGAGTRTITDSVLFGYRAMFGVRSSSGDCVVGQFAMFQNDGSTVDTARNTAYGGEAGYYVGGTNNVFFGYRCGGHASLTTLNGVVAIGYRAGDVAGGASALADNDFVIANAEIDSRRILWGNFATRALNMGGTLSVAGRVNANGGLRITGTSAPANSSATGEVGEVRTDADYIYVCTASNSWKRAALTTW